MAKSMNRYHKILPLKNLNHQLFKKGEYLFRQGDFQDSVFFIDEGGVLIIKDNIMLWSAQEDEIVGITSYNSKSPYYNFSALICNDSKIYTIPSAIFDELIRENHEFSKMIMTDLCKRIDRINHKTKSFQAKSSKNRLIDFIIEQSKSKVEKVLNLKLSELSEMLGVSTRLIKSIIKELEEKKIVVFKANKLEVLDLRGLEIIAKM